MSIARLLSRFGSLLGSDGKVPLAGLSSDVSTAISNATPSGAVAFFAMNTAPTGWIKANGAAISRTTYASLFAAIGTTFGAGNGSTTFVLPDLRGEFPRGWDDARGIDSGRAFGSSQTDALQAHSGEFHLVGGSLDGANFGWYGDLVNGVFTYGASANAVIGSHSGNAAYTTRNVRFDVANVARTAAETRSRNIALLACIKF